MTRLHIIASALILSVSSLTTLSMAQELVVTGNYLKIAPGSVSAVPYQSTILPQTTVDVPTETSFQEINNSESSLLNITTVTLSGSDSNQFSFSVSSIGSILPGNHGTIGVIFTPTSLGTKNATVTILSNDPVHPSYTFVISGTCLASLSPKSDINPGSAGPIPLMKKSRKAEIFSLKWKLDITNAKAGESEDGTVFLYSSNFPFADDSDSINCRFLGAFPFKSIKGSTPTKTSHKKVNVKIKNLPGDANEFTYIIALAFTFNDFEDTFDNNALISEFDTDK